MKRDITKLGTVLLHSNWSSLRRKYWSKIPTDMNVLIWRPKTWNIWGILDANSPRYIRKNPRSMYTRVPHVMAQFVLKNRKIVLYHRDSPNTRNSARLRSPSPIMAPDWLFILWLIVYTMGTRLAILRSCSWCFVICYKGTIWTPLAVFSHVAEIVRVKSTCKRFTVYSELTK